MHERIKIVERELYPRVLGRVMASLGEGIEPVALAGTLEGDCLLYTSDAADE